MNLVDAILQPIFAKSLERLPVAQAQVIAHKVEAMISMVKAALREHLQLNGDQVITPEIIHQIFASLQAK